MVDAATTTLAATAARDNNLGKSAASLAIKVATAGLTYAMLVVMTRVLGDTAYGHFAFGLALATLAAVVAGIGQQTAVLRFFPEDSVRGRPEAARGAVGAASALTLIGGGALTLLTVAAIFAWGAIAGAGQPALYVYAAALLILPLAFADTASAALRAQGSVWTALMPRDILWRALAPATAALLVALGLMLDGAQALALTAAMLIAVLVVQAAWAKRRGYLLAPSLRAVPAYWAERGAASRWFLVALIVDAASNNFDPILIGLFADPHSVGVYFNALRTAALMTLVMFAVSLVVAPPLARHFHAGDMKQAQGVLVFSAWAGFLFSLAMFGLFVIAGPLILSLFGESYTEGYLVLVILSVGLLFDAATGLSKTTMLMTGYERSYVVIVGVTMVASVLVQLVVIPAYGIVGAAVVNTLSRIVFQLLMSWLCIRRIGLDPTVLGVLRVNGIGRGASV